MMTKETYLSDPCGVSSLPYWKAATVRVPDGLRVLHVREVPEGIDGQRYFRLLHRMVGLASRPCPRALPRDR